MERRENKLVIPSAKLVPEELQNLGKLPGIIYPVNQKIVFDYLYETYYDEMVAYGKEAGICVIPAIEFDTKFEGFDTHILGYNLDYHHPCFDGYDKKIDAKIHDSFRGVMQRIKDHFGAVVEIDEIIEDISKGGNPFDKMYGRILHDPRNAHIEAFKPYQPGGHRSEPAVVNFYWDLLSAGTPCYVPVDYPKMEDIVKLLHEVPLIQRKGADRYDEK